MMMLKNADFHPPAEIDTTLEIAPVSNMMNESL